MNHGISGRKLNRTSSHRKALLSNMSRSLIKHELMKTTLPKAKELRPFVEKIITSSKGGSLADRRFAISVLGDRILVDKLFNDIALRFKNRQGGYLRIIKCGFRHGDKAPMAIIELVDRLDLCSPEDKKVEK